MKKSKEYHLPSPSDLKKVGCYISNSNGSIKPSSNKPLLFANVKQAKAVKAFAKLTLLMKWCNDAEVKKGFYFIKYKTDINSLFVRKANYPVSNFDLYFTSRKDARKIIHDKNWRSILKDYLMI